MERLITYKEFMIKVSVIKACIKEMRTDNFFDRKYLKYAVLSMTTEIECCFHDYEGCFRKWLDKRILAKDDASITEMLIESPSEIYDILLERRNSNICDNHSCFNSGDFLYEAMKRSMSDNEGRDSNA